MPETKKRHYPAERLKLHALQAKLEAEIADKQEMLIEVKKRVREADNTAILHIALQNGITPEELLRIVAEKTGGGLPAEEPEDEEEDPDEEEE